MKMKYNLWLQGYAYQTAARAKTELDRAKALGFSRILFYSGEGKAMWRSELLDAYSYVTPTFDPLKYAVSYAKSIGLEAEAWYSCGSIPRNWTAKLSGPHPDWDVINRAAANGSAWPSGFHCLDFKVASARQFIASVAQELVAMFPSLDAIHLDVIRWLAPVDNQAELWFGTGCASYVRDTVQLVSASIAPKPLTCAVASDNFGNAGQLWDSWFPYVQYLYSMSYTDGNRTRGASWEYLEHRIKEHAALTDKGKIIEGLAYFNKATGAEVAKPPSELVEQVKLCREYGFDTRLAIFDQRVTDAQMKAVKQEIGGDGIMDVITQLTTVETALRAKAASIVANAAADSAALIAQADAIKQDIVQLQGIDATLNTAADAIKVG